MAFEARYDVRVIEDGKVVTQRRFKLKAAAVKFLADKLVRRRKATIRKGRVFVLETFGNSVWGPPKTPLGPWQSAKGPLKEVFIHHPVIAELPVSASIEQEKAQMRLLEQIGISRGFNGISYSWIVFPSGRAWEGRGWLVIEAGTEGHNTSGDSISLAGNKDAFAMSEQQRIAVRKLIEQGQRVGALAKTGLDVRAHREVSQTGCPGKHVTAAQIDAWQKAVNAA